MINDLYTPLYVSETMTFPEPLKKDSIEFFLKELKKAHNHINFDVEILEMTHQQFINVASKWVHAPAIDNFSTSIINRYLSKDLTPRSYNFLQGHAPEYMSTNISDRGRFFCFNKIHSFLTTPFTHFRIPFSIGLVDKQFCIHPGNFRFMAMKFLPKDKTCSVIITLDRPENRLLLDTIISQQNFLARYNLKHLTDEQIVKILRVDEFNYASIQYSKASGLQIYEHHPMLTEYYQDYTISLNEVNIDDGKHAPVIREIVVNNIQIAKLEFYRTIDPGTQQIVKVYGNRWILPEEQVLL